MFENTDEHPVTVATKSIALSQATAHNVPILKETISQVESDNNKLKDEIISLKEEMSKRRKVECDMTPLKTSIIEQQGRLHDVKLECFTKIQKMADKMKNVEKHLEIVSQTNYSMRYLQANIEDVEEWRNKENNVPSILPVIKSYYISVHTLATTECQDLAPRFEENARKDLVGMMDLYEKYIYDIQRYIQWPKINLDDEHPIPFYFFQKLEDNYENIKVEVRVKEVFSKEDIQEFLVKPLMEYSHYTTFIHKFVISMEEYKKFNIAFDVKKDHIFNSREEKILTQHEACSKHFRKKGE